MTYLAWALPLTAWVALSLYAPARARASRRIRARCRAARRDARLLAHE